MYLVSIIIINFKEGTKGHFQNWDCRDLKSPELELELKSLELELELELKLFVSSGIGIGIGIENNGIGIELKKWNWPQPCLSLIWDAIKLMWHHCNTVMAISLNHYALIYYWTDGLMRMQKVTHVVERGLDIFQQRKNLNRVFAYLCL